MKAVLTLRTPRTAKTELEASVPNVPLSPVVESRTARTGIVELRARTREESTTANIDRLDFLVKLEDLGSAVRAALVLPPVVAGERLPFLTAGGTLSIPFDSPERYHWWRGGQSVAETLAEVRAALAIKKG